MSICSHRMGRYGRRVQRLTTHFNLGLVLWLSQYHLHKRRYHQNVNTYSISAWDSLLLRGEISANLFRLRSLEYLSMQYNSLGGSIPDLFGMTPCLTFLRLSHNYLTGTLPASLLALTSSTLYIFSYLGYWITTF